MKYSNPERLGIFPDVNKKGFYNVKVHDNGNGQVYFETCYELSDMEQLEKEGYTVLDYEWENE